VGSPEDELIEGCTREPAGARLAIGAVRDGASNFPISTRRFWAVAKRTAIAALIEGRIAKCSTDGLNAVEFDWGTGVNVLILAKSSMVQCIEWSGATFI
jgi:hypothetical protein